ncbi:MAG: L-ribulose-5-phosphate 4-epimerase [Epulopiscium sp. Nele67-Bin004]|nr:MAG: L-ribulose-5-phosphate 4-epimerase [Epulopiscium sp. Nele67-Bin004]
MKPYEIGIYEKSMPNTLTLKEKLIAGKAAGFDYLEISIDETDEKLARLEMTQEERQQLVRDMHETGLNIRTMCLSGHRKYPLGSKDANVRERSLEIMEKAIQLADDLGIRVIQLAGYDVYYDKGDEETRQLFIENLKKSTEMASVKGILLGFETMETDFMNSATKAMDYVNIVNSPYLNVYPDMGNISNAYDNNLDEVLQDFENAKGKIVAVHIKETVPGKFRDIPFGTGQVYFVEILKKAMELGVRRYVLEFWYVEGRDYNEYIKEARDFIETKFEALEG